MTRATVAYIDNPFAPAERRIRTVRSGQRLSRIAPRTRLPVIALVNGKPVLREHRGWQRCKIGADDQVVFASLPLGGGNGGASAMQALLQIALFAVAGPLAEMITGAASGMLFGAAQAGILLGGSMIINAIVPQPKLGGNSDTASPTYSLSSQGNAARVGAPIPVQYGRVKFYPDLAAQPYTEFAGEDQYLYQLMCLGAGEFDVEQILIEDTPITSFAEVETQIIGPEGTVTLFPTAVETSIEVAGQEVDHSREGTFTASGGVVTFTSTAHGLVSGQLIVITFDTAPAFNGGWQVASVPTADTFTVSIAGTPSSGACDFSLILGGLNGFIVGDAGTLARSVAVDLVLPYGLFRRNSDGDLSTVSMTVIFQARQIDEVGLPIGSWVTIGSETISGRAPTPIRRTFRYNMWTGGRFAVRAYRGDGASADPTTESKTVLWAGLRAYSADPIGHGPVTLLAVRMRATGNLSAQASRRIAIIATRKISTWTGSAWTSPGANRSPWAIADIARDSNYGGGLSNDRIDLAGIAALGGVAEARRDYFDYRFDQSGSWWDAVQLVAAAFRARAYMQGGVLRVVRDEAQPAPVAVFSQRNIKAGSLEIDYVPASEDTADAVRATYFDGTVWSEQSFVASVPQGTAYRPAKIDLPGITSRAHATREAVYRAAVNRYRRKFVSFEAEMDGFIPAVGDQIGVQHDMPGWGQSAEAVGWAAPWLTVDQDIAVVPGLSVVGLRRNDGSVSGPFTVIATSGRSLHLSGAPDFTPEVNGFERERTHVLIGTVSTWRTLAKVVRCRPISLDAVRIEAVVDEPAVYAAELGVAVRPMQTSNLIRPTIRPVITGLFARRWPDSSTRIVLGWRPAVGAEAYSVEMAVGDDVNDPEVSWTRVADVTSAQVSVEMLHPMRTLVRVRGTGRAAGDWVGAAIGTLIPDFWLTDATSFWSASDSDPFWS